MSTLGFVTPWILAGLAAIALPILIHYLTRARPRRIKYPTLHFLLEAASGRQALHRLRVWVILAIRGLAVCALVLLFSRPFLRAPGAEATPGATRRVVLLIDASLSMRAVQGGISLFTKARAEAADVLRGLEEGSAGAVVFMGARPRAALPALSQNLPLLHQALVGAEPTYEVCDPSAALALAARMLEGKGSVYVFSDFQRTNWSAVRLDEMHGMTCFLRPMTEGGVDNLAITGVKTAPAEPTVGENVELTCTVFNGTGKPRRETVRLDMEGVAQEAGIALQPFSSRDLTFTFSLPAVGCFPGKVSLGPDALKEDDIRWFSIRARKELQVLIISDEDPEDRNGAAFFMSVAIAPSERAKTGFAVVRRHSQDTDLNVLEKADVFAIVAPADLTGQAAEVIARRVNEGAHLICVLDGPTAPAILRTLAAASGGVLSPPFRPLRPVLSGGEGEPFAAMHTTGGPFKLFDDPTQGDLASLLVRRHYLTEILAGRKDEVLIYFADGSAALALSPAGRGAAVFANFPLRPDGGSLPGSPLFPALMHELLRTLRGSAEDQATTPGFAWQIDVPGAATPKEPAYDVVSPSGGKVEATVVARGRAVRLALPAAEIPGHYRVMQGGALVAVGLVNVDPRESDTRALPLNYLTDPAGAGKTGVAVLDDEGKLRRAGTVLSLWPWLAGFAAAFLGLEMLLLALWRKVPQRAVTPLFKVRAVQ